LILLAFLFPFTIYVLVLGLVNRRANPLVVSGPWDFVGILFAASGFLLLGGPAIFSSLSERWRTTWLLGPDAAGSAPPGEGGWGFWVFLSIAYFVLVVAGSAFMLWRQRAFTSIYNVTPGILDKALQRVLDRLGLNPVRSGHSYLFTGTLVPVTSRRVRAEGIQAPHLLPLLADSPEVEALEVEEIVEEEPAPPTTTTLPAAAALEVEPFPFMRHVTLRWDPPDAPVRKEVEASLIRALRETFVPYHPLGSWFLMTALILLLLGCFGTTALIVVKSVLL